MHDVSNRNPGTHSLAALLGSSSDVHTEEACFVRACVSLSAGVCAEIRKSIRVHAFFKSTLPTVAAWRKNNSQRVLMRED